MDRNFDGRDIEATKGHRGSDLSDEKDDLAMFVKQIVGVLLKDYEYEVRILSRDEWVAEELPYNDDVQASSFLYVLIKAKDISMQMQRIATFANRNVHIINSNLIYWIEGEHTVDSLPKLNSVRATEKKEHVVFRKSKTILPSWLDNYLFEELGAQYAPGHSRYEYNLNLNGDELKVYLGTYFPRSYSEMFCIFDNMFQNPYIWQVFDTKKNIKIFDFCSGTGGELIGLLSAIDKYYSGRKNIQIIASDGNALALDYLHKIVVRAAIVSKHHCQLVTIHQEIKNIKDIEALSVPCESPDIVLCDKVCCEFISHGICRNSYALLADYLSKRLSHEGLLIILDVTTKCEETGLFYPQMMNRQINNFVRNSNEFETLLPLSCGTYKNCDISCFAQQTFYVTHLQKSNDESRVCYHVLCRKKLKENFTTSNLQNKAYVINPIRYRKNTDGAYCTYSEEKQEIIDSFNLNN